MCSDILQECRYADAQESSIHIANLSDMCSVDMKVLRLAGGQQLRFQYSKRSYMASAAMKSGRIT